MHSAAGASQPRSGKQPTGAAPPGCAAGVGACLWDGALVLAGYLAAQPRYKYVGLRCVELGAGVGLVGIALAMMGARCLVTDIAKVLPLLSDNLAANSFDPSARCAAPWDHGCVDVQGCRLPPGPAVRRCSVWLAPQVGPCQAPIHHWLPLHPLQAGRGAGLGDGGGAGVGQGGLDGHGGHAGRPPSRPGGRCRCLLRWGLAGWLGGLDWEHLGVVALARAARGCA